MRLGAEPFHAASRARRFAARSLCRRLFGLARPRQHAVSAAELQFGQPVHETHPHLLEAGEVTPGISALEYAQRRSKLAKTLPRNSIALLAASDLKYRSGAVFYEFHQDPDFLYLTGFKEQEAVAVIETGTTESDDDYAFHLYVRPKDPKSELWDGARSGVQAAQDVFNADEGCEAGDVGDIHKTLPDLLQKADHVFTDLPSSILPQSDFTRYLSGVTSNPQAGFPLILRETMKSSPNKRLQALRPILNDLRAVKSAAEVANMRRAGQLSARAVTDAMRQPFDGEKQLADFLDARFKALGCDGPAYVPVVAGGRNALSIHYVRNDARLAPSDLVLVDAGGSYGSYITDITRTWPASGTFTPAQKDLYEAVLAVQRACVAMCRSGGATTTSLDEIHITAETGLRDNLSRLGFDVSTPGALQRLFPHHVGHHIGLDVHDAPGYPRSRPLRAGNCVTVEPGVYVGPNEECAPVHFRGMGVRVEDSVAVMDEGPLVLTVEAVKEVVDIEALRR